MLNRLLRAFLLTWRKIPAYLQIPLLLLLWIFYIILPLDLFPDFMGPPGRIDDILIIFVLMVHYFKNAKNFEQPQEKPQREEEPKKSSPYDVLEISPGASKQEIEKAYKRLAAQYHPDKVAHLGDELKKVAHEKMIEIQNAYEALR